MPYNVYMDASLRAPCDHWAIFIEIEPDHSGFIFQVTGNIQAGMTFGHRKSNKPEDSTEFMSKTFIGTVSEENYAKIQSTVEGIPAPRKQFDGLKRIYRDRPLRHCQRVD